jgi:hypothetical protein
MKAFDQKIYCKIVRKMEISIIQLADDFQLMLNLNISLQKYLRNEICFKSLGH